MKPYSEYRSIEDYVVALSADAKREIELGERLLWSVKHCADLLSVTPWQVYRLLDEQRMKSVYIGRRRLVVAESLRQFVRDLPTYPPG